MNDSVSGGLSAYRGREITRLEATIGRLDKDVAAWINRTMAAENTIECVKALLDEYGTRSGSAWWHATNELRDALKDPSCD
jgi:hypothetical protein